MRVPLLVVCGLAALSIWGCGSDGGAEPDSTSEAAKVSAAKKEVASPKGSADRPRSLWISLDNFEGPENIGILMAEARGYFKQKGLEVTISRGVKPRNPLSYVNAGTVELGVAREPQIVMANEEGKPIVAIGNLLTKTTAALIWLKGSGINDIGDLKGRTIGTGGTPYQRRFLEVILAKQGIAPDEVKIRGFGHNLTPALLRGKADAIFGGSWNLEGVAVKAEGGKPVITRVTSLGIPAYDEAQVIVRTDRLTEDPGAFRAFMAAVARGTEAAISDPAEAAEVSLSAGERNGELSRSAVVAQLRATLPLLSASGRMDEDQAGDLVAWMSEEGLIEEEPPVGEMLTNEYLGP